MSEPVLRQPALVSFVSGPSEGARVPKLRVRRCGCGHLLFPPQPYGCEKCGADGHASTPMEIDARGVLTALAVIYVHPKLATPFVLGRVTLDSGPVVDAWLDAALTESAIGSRVRGTLVPTPASEGNLTVLDLRFALEGEL